MARSPQQRAKKRRDFARRPANKEAAPRVLIVTEGEKTEPNYFKDLIQELRLASADVHIEGKGGSAPRSIVETAEAILTKHKDIEYVFLVFDRDRHGTYDEAIQAAHSLGPASQNVAVITSVPCFEVWYMLHVRETSKPYGTETTGRSPADCLVDDLKAASTHFTTYNKAGSKSLYDALRPLRNVARQRAAALLSNTTSNGARFHHEDPSTRVHDVVNLLEGMSQKQKQGLA